MSSSSTQPELLPDAIPDDAVDPLYARKAHILNAAIQKIGMGRYQWRLFCVAGFGWAADNVHQLSC